MNDATTTQPTASQAGTRDLFLSYNRRDSEAVLRVWELLRARSLTTFFDRNDLTPGLPWQAELERAIAQSRAVAVFIGAAGIGAWQRPEKELALDRQVQAERAGQGFPVIPVLLPDAEADKVTGFLTRNTWIDLRGGLDNAAAAVALDALARAVTGESSPTPTPQSEPLCPYRGLEPFHEDDAPLFFGRDQFAEELLQKVKAQPLIAVVGPSGSGKSSVVQAGLLPRLRREGWPNQTWEAVIFTPREQPFHSLARELLPLYEPAKSRTEQMIEARTLAEALAAGAIPLDDPIHAALKTSQTANRLLLVVDQFEELFTLSEERYRQPFVEALLATATRADSPVTVVLTLRADFYGQALGLSRALSDSLQHGQVNLGPMTRDELRQAIEAPAQHAGLRFEPGLVARLLDDVADRPGNLPLLEFALKELWLRRQGAMLTNEQYDASGKLEGAISQRANAQFEHVPAGKRDALLRAFTRLVRVSAANEEETDTRQRVRLQEFDAAVQPLLKDFAKERLLVMSRDEATNEEIVEVAHEALIRRWDKLKELLNEDRQFLLWRQRLGLVLSEWQRTDRNEGALLRGALLEEARRWCKEREKDLNQQEREFIQESELVARKPRRRLAAAAALVMVMAAAAFGWKLWDDSDAAQIKKILSQPTDLVRVAANDGEKFQSANDWLKTLVITGRPYEALEAANKIEDVDVCAIALVNIVGALTKVGKVKEAQQTAAEALKVARNMDFANAGGTPAFVDVIEGLAKAGMMDEVRKATEEWLEIIQKSVKARYRPWAMSALAGALAGAGEIDIAARVTNESLRSASEIANPYSAFDALTNFARGLAKADKLNEALAMAHKINDVNFRSQAINRIVEVLIKARKVGKAFETARMIEDPSSRALALVNVAEALIKAGELNLASQAANEALCIKVELVPIQSSDIVSMVEGLMLANAGKTDAALEAVSKIEGGFGGYYRSKAMSGIVEALVKTGKTSEALETARKIEDVSYGSKALVKVAEAMTKNREMSRAMSALDEAERVAQQVTTDEDKSACLADVAKGLAKLRYYKLARETANRCTSSGDKLAAYTAILREYHLQHHPEDAKLF